MSNHPSFFENLPPHTSLTKLSVVSSISPRLRNTNKSIKLAFDLNHQFEPISATIGNNTVFTSRNSSLFQNFDFNMIADGIATPFMRRKKTASISLGKIMAKLKMGTHSSLPLHRFLIDEKDPNQLNSLDNYSTEELLSVLLEIFLINCFLS